jgi:hypothetical protein
MARTSPTIKVIEIGGDRFESLEAAQESARVMLAFNLAQIIKSMIEEGALEIKNNQIIPKEKTERKIDNE